jgi:hypothetical protein
VTHHEHPSRATRWSGGRVVGLPPELSPDCTVWFALEPEEDGSPTWEGLPAQRLSQDTAVVRGVPLYAYGLAFGDVVATLASAEGPLVASRVLRRSDEVTFRVLGSGDGDRTHLELMQALEPLGCWFDVSTPRFLAISAGPEVAARVAAHLDEGEARGRWEYETGDPAPRQP